MAKTLKGLRLWIGEALEFTIGNPASEKHMPPSIGPQPYRDKPQKEHWF